MQFVYHPDSGNQIITLEGESFIHLYKSRRTKYTQTLQTRNLKDDFLYTYKPLKIDRKSATLALEDTLLSPQKSNKSIHIILSIIDSKALQKALPLLNELGLSKLTLFYADFSQKNEKIDKTKFEKILINSCQQCGRSDLMIIEIVENLDCVLDLYPYIGVFDFGGANLSKAPLIPILIGPEGGFSPKERERLNTLPTYSTGENLILRAESACVYATSLLQGISI